MRRVALPSIVAPQLIPARDIRAVWKQAGINFDTAFAGATTPVELLEPAWSPTLVCSTSSLTVTSRQQHLSLEDRWKRTPFSLIKRS